MFGKLKRMPWTGVISRDLSFRWVSEGCLILRQPLGFGIGWLNPSLLITLREGLNGLILTLRIRSPMEMDPGNMIIVSRQLALRQYSRSSNNITTHMFLSNALIGQSYLTCIKQVTLTLGNVNLQWDFGLEFVHCICYLSTFFLMYRKQMCH